MYDLYRTTHKIFMFDKPELSQELNNGLILAIGGFCQQRDRFLFKVNKYFVAMNNGWLCNCPGNEFATINDLYGHSGQICKHICAVAICFSVKQWTSTPKNIFKLLERLIEINYIFDCQLPNSKVKILTENGNLRLQIGRKKTSILATRTMRKWQMTDDAKSLYEDFVNDL